MNQPQQKFDTSVAILIGSVIISLSILISGNVITLKGVSKATNQPSPSPVAVNPSVPPIPTPDVSKVDRILPTDHVRGNRNAEVLFIEYSDLECPFCKRFHPTAKEAFDSYNGKVAWVYRHFPLDQIHSKARKEAEAVECAAELGGDEAFWKLTDKIYEVTPGNNGLNLDDLPKLAGEVGLNTTAFKACLDSGRKAAKVEADYQSGVKAGISGTPGSIILNTKTNKATLIPGAYPIDMLKQSIDGVSK